MKRLKTINVIVLSILYLFLCSGVPYLLGVLGNLDNKIEAIEQRINHEQPLTLQELRTALERKKERVGHEQQARSMAVWLGESQFYAFLNFGDPLEEALQKLPRILEREDSLLQNVKQANSGIQRFNVWKTKRLLTEIDNLWCEEYGYRTVLRAYDN